MVRRLCALGIVSCALAAMPHVLAQAADHLHDPNARPVYDGPPLTLAAAIDEALARNATLIALRTQFEAVQQRPAQQRFLMPPSFEAQIWQWPVTTLNPLNTNMYMFTMQQDVPGRGKRALRAAVAEKDVELASVQIAQRAREVIHEVTRTYADIAVARQAIDIHLGSVALLRQFADATTLKYAAGRSPQQDVLKAVTELSKLHEDLVMHEETESTAAARLNTLLGRDPQTPIGPLTQPREEVTLPSSEELQRLAIEQQPDLKVVQVGIERAQAALAVVTADRKPDFTVGGGYMLMPRGAGAWTASAGITWPNAPWSRGLLEAHEAEAKADVNAALANARAAETQIRLAVHEAYIHAKAAGDRAALLRGTVLPQSEQTLEVSRVAYQSDRVDFLALIDNQRALLDARLGYYRALTDRELALADLARAIGTDVPALSAASEEN